MLPDPENDTDASGVRGVKSVNSMSLKVFRRKLINHFKFFFASNEIKWPARDAEMIVENKRAWVKFIFKLNLGYESILSRHDPAPV